MITTSPRRLPLYAQIRQLVANRIAEGEWQEHDALPSEWDLAAELSVSQGTVRKALTELVAELLALRAAEPLLLSSDEVADVLAYLVSLKGQP